MHGTILLQKNKILFGRQTSYTPDEVGFTYYTYRPDDLRHSIGNTVHAWSGTNIVADIKGGTTTIYFRSIGLIFAETAGTRTYYHQNAHGDVIMLTDGTGTILTTYEYDAFGREWDALDTDNNPFRYCGEYFDKQTKTIYLRARYYDSAYGRFTQEDPIRSGTNWYSYCNGNPVMFVDPSGCSAEDIFCGIMLAMDDNNFGGLMLKFAQWATKKDGSYEPESEYDFYLGRLIGDALSLLKGAAEIKAGITMILGSIIVGGGITVGSGGTLAIGGVSISLAGVAAGTVSITVGGAVVVASVSNFSDDLDRLYEAKNERKSGVPKQESEIWNSLDNVKGKKYKSSGEGNKKQYYDWDYLHNEIEVYDRNGRHLGAMDPTTGEMIKPPEKGRTIKLK